MHNLIRKCINLIPGWVRGNLIYFFSANDTFDYLDKNSKKVIVTLAADYGNLGDVAITQAHCTFIKDTLKDYQVISLPISRTYRDLKSLKKKINKHDIITMVGGGNMGSLYEGIENQRRFIIKNFPNNKIVSFPQSIFYAKDQKGTWLLNKAKASYSSHSNLTFMARDDASYRFMKEHFTSNTVDTAPDTVLYLDESDKTVLRDKHQLTLSLRQDKESSLTADQRQMLAEELSNVYSTIVHRDTDLGEITLSVANGTKELQAIWQIFKTSSLVITDRLHGMIFCAITKTPCIAINNNNGKVAGAYTKWLKHIPYISMLNRFDIAAIKKEQARLAGMETQDTNNSVDFTNLQRIITSKEQ